MPMMLFLAAAAAAAPVPATPAVLAPYITNGHFQPGDYGWYRGALAGPSPADAARWAEVDRWKVACIAADQARAIAELKALGVADPKLRTGTYDDGLCGEVISAQPQLEKPPSQAAFEAALPRARLAATAVVWSSKLAQSVVEPDEPTTSSELKARPTTDQVLRTAATWNGGEVKGAPELSPVELGIAQSLIWSAIRVRDHDNTRWLKALVATSGWPTIAQVGSEASSSAWLLVQHADDDPVFQYRMLRLMEPLAAKGEVSKKNFAYLYDRVMLQVSGKQRYGTQMTCTAGKYASLPLEDAGRVDTYRHDAGMPPVAEYAAKIAKLYGPCGG